MSYFYYLYNFFSIFFTNVFSTLNFSFYIDFIINYFKMFFRLDHKFIDFSYIFTGIFCGLLGVCFLYLVFRVSIIIIFLSFYLIYWYIFFRVSFDMGNFDYIKYPQDEPIRKREKKKSSEYAEYYSNLKEWLSLQSLRFYLFRKLDFPLYYMPRISFFMFIFCFCIQTLRGFHEMSNCIISTFDSFLSDTGGIEGFFTYFDNIDSKYPDGSWRWSPERDGGSINGTLFGPKNFVTWEYYCQCFQKELMEAESAADVLHEYAYRRFFTGPCFEFTDPLEEKVPIYTDGVLGLFLMRYNNIYIPEHLVRNLDYSNADIVIHFVKNKSLNDVFIEKSEQLWSEFRSKLEEEGNIISESTDYRLFNNYFSNLGRIKNLSFSIFDFFFNYNSRLSYLVKLEIIDCNHQAIGRSFNYHENEEFDCENWVGKAWINCRNLEKESHLNFTGSVIYYYCKYFNHFDDYQLKYLKSRLTNNFWVSNLKNSERFSCNYSWDANYKSHNLNVDEAISFYNPKIRYWEYIKTDLLYGKNVVSTKEGMTELVKTLKKERYSLAIELARKDREVNNICNYLDNYKLPVYRRGLEKSFARSDLFNWDVCFWEDYLEDSSTRKMKVHTVWDDIVPEDREEKELPAGVIKFD